MNLEIQILVFLGFLSFFVAHTLFWYMGLFHSMGLKRVLISVMPLIAIIALMGFNFITLDLLKNKKFLRLTIGALLLAYIIIFPFTSNPAAIIWKKDMMLSKDQQSAIKVADFITQNIGTDNRYVFAHPYLSEVLDVDYFDRNERLELKQGFMARSKPGDIIIWENWYSVIEYGITEAYLDSLPELTNLYNLKVDDDGHEVLYSVYKRK